MVTYFGWLAGGTDDKKIFEFTEAGNNVFAKVEPGLQPSKFFHGVSLKLRRLFQVTHHVCPVRSFTEFILDYLHAIN